ncbi:MAG: hypothetical protein Ct9H90mP16_04540 [Candidatus Poseidoniales archaeon]|nr:MAG: hypothetical protein Ct9H90mP16_04540 [Candidatus Poseidoniales archaeon]
MRPGSKLPHEIRIKDRHEVGLAPLADVAIIKEGSDELPEPIVEEVPEGEIMEEVIEEPAIEEAAVEEAPSEEVAEQSTEEEATE